MVPCGSRVQGGKNYRIFSTDTSDIKNRFCVDLNLYGQHSNLTMNALSRCCFGIITVAAMAPLLKAEPLVAIDTVTVSDAGNLPSPDGGGAVGYDFNIGKYEVTIAQYVTFLNSVATVTTNEHILSLWNSRMATDANIAGIRRDGSGTASDPYVYSSIGSSNRPVSWVSWFDAARFVNWLHNGATIQSDTETGAYTLNGSTEGLVAKNIGAKWWIPSDAEWLKAGHYKSGGVNAGYWIYPTQSDQAPSNLIGSERNNANIWAGSYSVTQSPDYAMGLNYLTDVGSFSASASAYGTFDQAGNLQEWTDAVLGVSRRIRGGSWVHAENTARASFRSEADPRSENDLTGFRIARIAGSTPSVTSIYPNLGPVGQWVYVHGSGFLAGETMVSVGGISGIKAYVYGRTQLGFTVPPGASGSTAVQVTTDYGSASSTAIYTVGVPDEPPTVTSFTPSLGPVGQWVYVFGSGFVRDATTITFAGQTNIWALVYGPDQLGFTIPEEAVGSSSIGVTTPNGSFESLSLLTVGTPTAPPSFDRLQEYAGFDWVYMDGENFVHGQTQIIFDDGTTIPGHVYGPSSLGFTPPGEWQSLGSITVKTPYGQFTRNISRMANLAFFASANKRYQIQFSTDLENWTPVGDPIEGEAAAFRLMATHAGRPSEFYRVVELQN